MPEEAGSELSQCMQTLFATVDSSRLRQLVFQAVAITPLIVLLPLDLAKAATICPEETLAVSSDLPVINLPNGTFIVEYETLREPKTTTNP